MRQVLRMDEANDRLVERNAGRDEDREYDRQPSEPFGADVAEKERDPERNCCQSITRVVDQIGEQRDRVRKHEDGDLRARRQAEDRQAHRDRADTGTRAQDRAVDEPV